MIWNGTLEPKCYRETANLGDDYVLTIEGTPSLSSLLFLSKQVITLMKKVVSFGNRKLTPNYIVTIMSVLNTIPTIVEAAAGLHPSIRPQVTWMQDMRDSVE